MTAALPTAERVLDTIRKTLGTTRADLKRLERNRNGRPTQTMEYGSDRFRSSFASGSFRSLNRDSPDLTRNKRYRSPRRFEIRV